MSNKQQNTTNFPDAPGKITDDDKCGLHESSRTDSGFISSGNLLVFGEIVSEEIQPEAQDSGIIPDNEAYSKTKDKFLSKETQQEPLDSGVITDSELDSKTEDKKDQDYMRLDSGVCLSESFSNLHIKSGLNDLNCPKIKQTPVATFARSETKIKAPVLKASDDIPWKLYYEQDEDGDTHLHTAIVNGSVDVALALIRAAPHPRLLDTPNDDAQTPLHLAVETAQWIIARWLIVAGARPCPRDIRGDSPLHIAARGGDYESLRAIANPIQQQERDALALSYQAHMYQPCDFDQWNYLGQTCVHVAAIHGHVEMLRHLVWYGADINAREGCSGYTALHIAVEQKNEALVHLLLQCDKLNVEAVTYGGRNALELKILLPSTIRQALRNRGLPSPYSSDDDDEIDSDDSEDELMYENTHLYSVPMVNASA